jgi:hypothetical protein
VQGNNKLKVGLQAKNRLLLRDAIKFYGQGLELRCSDATLNAALYNNRAHVHSLLGEKQNPWVPWVSNRSREAGASKHQECSITKCGSTGTRSKWRRGQVRCRALRPDAAACSWAAPAPCLPLSKGSRVKQKSMSCRT